MQNSIKTFRTFKSALRKLKLRTAIFLLLGMCLAQSLHGQMPTDPCAPNEYPFIGVPAPNLCEQYGSLDYNVQVGSESGTGITNSSQLGTSFSGNIWIKGTFYIDNNFSFVNSIVKIDPGATILVLPPSSSTISKSFTIDNSKLFACAQMWNGIVLSNNTTIFTKNGTEIEDADVAIKADNIQFSTLVIENTTFNRDRTGILLVQSPSLAKAATIARFRENNFTCTSALNGTMDEITMVGVKTIGVPFTINPGAEAFKNTFDGLKYGILTEDANTTIGGSFFNFNNIRIRGISMTEGSLDIANSAWTDCEYRGVSIGIAHNVYVLSSTFTFTSAAPEIANNFYREGIYIAQFGLNADVIISSDFNGNLGDKSTPISAIHLEGDNVGAGTEILVLACNFTIAAKTVRCINMPGVFPESSTTWISGCNFNITDLPGGVYFPNINCYIGQKNNVHIWGNEFGYFYTSGNIYSIAMNDSDGIGNYITGNHHNSYAGIFARLSNSQNVTLCSNTVRSVGTTNAFVLNGTNTGTDFTENEILACGSGVQIQAGSIMDFQPHKGNKWLPVEWSSGGVEYITRAGKHAWCLSPDLASSSKFTVHTDQSIWNGATYDFFSEFYPEIIDPNDPVYDFFKIDVTGIPASGCTSNGFNGPGGGGGLDRIIADGQLPTSSINPAMDWISKNYLYKKLKYNPSLISSYSGFSSFIANNANTNVGIFFEVGKKIHEAYTASQSQYQQSQQLMGNIKSLLDNIKIIDNQLNEATSISSISSLAETKSDYIEQIRSYQADYNVVAAAYETQKMAKLQEALTLNQGITPNAIIETNQKR